MDKKFTRGSVIVYGSQGHDLIEITDHLSELGFDYKGSNIPWDWKDLPDMIVILLKPDNKSLPYDLISNTVHAAWLTYHMICEDLPLDGPKECYIGLLGFTSEDEKQSLENLVSNLYDMYGEGQNKHLHAGFIDKPLDIFKL